MSTYPMINVSTKCPTHCGEFLYSSKMPWGPWYLMRKPKALFEVADITVLECFALEMVQDENGVAANCSPENDPCDRHFLVGKATDGHIIWWHNLGQVRLDPVTNKSVKSSISFDIDKVVIKGFGFEIEPQERLTIDVHTGKKTKLAET